MLLQAEVLLFVSKNVFNTLTAEISTIPSLLLGRFLSYLDYPETFKINYLSSAEPQFVIFQDASFKIICIRTEKHLFIHCLYFVNVKNIKNKLLKAPEVHLYFYPMFTSFPNTKT